MIVRLIVILFKFKIKIRNYGDEIQLNSCLISIPRVLRMWLSNSNFIVFPDILIALSF